jgi:tRNA threonylcarbamoyladenosine biosynthesis protein TsaE
MSQEHLTASPGETRRLGEKIAKELLKKKSRQRVFGLKGELGGGKTTFLQGFAKGLGIKEKILSPTFVILKKFKIPKNKNFKNFYHIDCYRLQQSKELLDLGFEEIISNSKNIVVVEWADKIKRIMPKSTVWIKFDFIDEKKRKITIEKVLC